MADNNGGMKYLVKGVGIDPLTSHLIHVTLERDTFERALLSRTLMIWAGWKAEIRVKL